MDQLQDMPDYGPLELTEDDRRLLGELVQRTPYWTLTNINVIIRELQKIGEKEIGIPFTVRLSYARDGTTAPPPRQRLKVIGVRSERTGNMVLSPRQRANITYTESEHAEYIKKTFPEETEEAEETGHILKTSAEGSKVIKHTGRVTKRSRQATEETEDTGHLTKRSRGATKEIEDTEDIAKVSRRANKKTDDH